MSRAYYNEFNPFAAQWLRNLIDADMIAPGDVDERSITDVKATDLEGYTQCHFFAGIGGWSLALRLAGWPDDKPVWTGSCPCQAFSIAGKQKAYDDDRHLWPAWFNLIRQCRPATLFGEQVENAIKWGWLDLVQTDLEGEGYATAAAVLPACCIGAPHLRKRLWFVGNSHSQRLEGHSRNDDGTQGRQEQIGQTPATGVRVGVENSERIGRGGRSEGVYSRSEQPVQAERQRSVDSMADTQHTGRHDTAVGRCPGKSETESGMLKPQGRSTDTVLQASQQQWGDTDWLYCRDEKWRPIKRGVEPLAYGLSGTVETLKAYGNAIVPQVGAAFIKAVMEINDD